MWVPILNSGRQAWQQTPLLIEPSFWSLFPDFSFHQFKEKPCSLISGSPFFMFQLLATFHLHAFPMLVPPINGTNNLAVWFFVPGISLSIESKSDSLNPRFSSFGYIPKRGMVESHCKYLNLCAGACIRVGACMCTGHRSTVGIFLICFFTLFCETAF